MSEQQGRSSAVDRDTKETAIRLELNLDGRGVADVSTGIGFLDHMLESFTKHGMFDLTLTCTGDLHVDGHHTVEDVGICLGKACAKAIGSGESIRRFGNAIIPMDEALVQAVLDVSGRPFLAYGIMVDEPLIGSFDPKLTEEFFRAFVSHARITLHFQQISGKNGHHIIEAAFKAMARALRDAVMIDPQIQGVVSTKGQLDLGKGEGQ